MFPANFALDRLTPGVFSARRRPDRLHYRMVRNVRTGCLRADPILDDDTLGALYAGSVLTYQNVAADVVATYLRYAERVWPLLPDWRGVLEIGCGAGAFLSAVRHRFDTVAGVEPSRDAIARAEPEIRPSIRHGMMRAGLFPPESFSLVCGFQVLDHLADPNAVVRASREALGPGGVAFWICHDIGSPIARLLGRYCPMVDIEHVVLYNRATLARLFENNGFEVHSVFGVANRYPLEYWAHLAPLPGALGSLCRRLLAITPVGGWHVHANFGNMGIIARKR